MESTLESFGQQLATVARGYLGSFAQPGPERPVSVSGLISIGTPVSRVIAALGAPVSRTRNQLHYELDQFPSHRFVFHAQDDHVLYGALERRIPTALPPPPVDGPREAWNAWYRSVAEQGACYAELGALLGPPANTLGWWPIEEHVFGADRRVVCCLGVVVPRARWSGARVHR